MTTAVDEQLIEVETGAIEMNPDQPRRDFSEGELESLAASIQAVGLIHPPVVRELPAGKYELVAGERRFRACKLLGMSKIWVIVRNFGRTQSAEAALVENIQRVDLNPLEVAFALKALMDEYGYGQEELGTRVGKKRSTVANYLRLLSLPVPVQQSLQKRVITMGHAKVILSLTSKEKQSLLHELILRDELTVRQAEAAAKRMEEKKEKRDPVYQTRDFYLEHLESKLRRSLGTKVSLKGTGTRGRMVVEYYSLDDLQHILDKLEVSGDD